MADRPSNAGREDTVVRPLSGQAPRPTPAKRAPRGSAPAPAGPRPSSPPPGAASSPATPARGERTTQTPSVRKAASSAGAAVKKAAGSARTSKSAAPKPGRRARLRLTRIDPWSVMKTSFLLSIALGVVTVVAVLMVWTVLGAADVWSSINSTVQDVIGSQDSSSTFDIEDYLGTRRVVGFTMIVAAVDVILLTAIATLGAFLYNMSASLLGGIEVTLAEDS
jgi:hypothetical protein